MVRINRFAGFSARRGCVLGLLGAVGLGLIGLGLIASCGGAGAPRSAQADTAMPGPVTDTRSQEQLEVTVEPNGAGRRILARPETDGASLEISFNILGLPADERENYTFQWDFGDGATAMGAIVWHIYEQDGTYLVTVEAMAPDGLLAYSLTDEVALGAAAAPNEQGGSFYVVFASELEYGETTATLRATAQTSTLAQGETVNFAWTFADGSADVGGTVTHVLEGVSPYLVSVTAQTSTGRSAETFKYFALPGALGPTTPDEEEENEETELAADAGPDQTVESASLVTLNGSRSSIPTSAKTTIRWRKISGTSVTLASPETLVTTFSAPRVQTSSETLRFELELVASEGSVSDQVAVTVVPAGAHQLPDSIELLLAVGGIVPDPDRRAEIDARIDAAAAAGFTHVVLAGRFKPHLEWVDAIRRRGHRIGTNCYPGHGQLYEQPWAPFEEDPDKYHAVSSNAFADYPHCPVFIPGGAIDQEQRCPVLEGMNIRRAICPGYQGRLWRNALDALQEQCSALEPEVVLVDCELWANYGAQEAVYPETVGGQNVVQACSRCQGEAGYEANRAARILDIKQAIKEVVPDAIVIFHATVKASSDYSHCYYHNDSIHCGRFSWAPSGISDYESPEQYALPRLEVVDQIVEKADLVGTVPVINTYGMDDSRQYIEPFSPNIMRAAGQKYRSAGVAGIILWPGWKSDGSDWDYWFGQAQALIEGLTVNP